jgi:cytochrome b
VNASSAFPADRQGAAADTPPTMQRILIWDAPVRVFHALMVLSFIGAWITAESERWRLAHVTLGYTMAGLVAFRLLWGLVGPRHARFSSFVRGPRAVGRYLSGLLRGQPEHHVGHNPAGALAIVGLLTLTAVVTASGWVVYQGLGPDSFEELHEGAANALMALVAVHVAGVAVSSWLHRENLMGAMLTGHKWGRPADGLRRAWHSVAALMLAAVLAFWWQQWQAPVGMSPSFETQVGTLGPVAPADPGHRGRAGDGDDD